MHKVEKICWMLFSLIIIEAVITFTLAYNMNLVQLIILLFLVIGTGIAFIYFSKIPY